ncbi:isoprenylcysteine carboxylmethyltransferase family protein [Clostridium autoethanogenum]|uniref:Isoprenylcysteine carboxylmethyltransferase family protein n=1 Tax=Clostridium autoethanogenum TaxID=84023 RepID=A0A3M0SWQ7_9CLOT|nr:isoprenylcysteine carboxylmethyltransferase family protein [Clostridium autoethanogenum]RMD02315.1 isoprenylcysteine carboxylmethyltransferase family protein [Clostridium autoethanogenum]
MSNINIVSYIWSIFWIYWILAAIKTRSNVKKESSGQMKIERSVHVILVIIAYVITLFQFKNTFLWNRIIPNYGYAQYIGITILVLSLLFAIWARIVLGRNWSGAIQKVEGQRLVCSGPYKYIRNPIYTSMVCGFFGTFITFGSLTSFIGFCIILITYIIKINREQRFLIIEFGDEYEKYIKRSWALIPYIF